MIIGIIVFIGLRVCIVMHSDDSDLNRSSVYIDEIAVKVLAMPSPFPPMTIMIMILTIAIVTIVVMW